jgi:hypothetical protein
MKVAHMPADAIANQRRRGEGSGSHRAAAWARVYAAVNSLPNRGGPRYNRKLGLSEG